jgi:CspA family cold shock protein
MNGKVKRITDKGFGFILGDDKKEYFFHSSALKNVKFDDLREGTEVTFEDAEGTKGPRAEDIYV